MLKVPDCAFTSWYWFGYGHWSLVHPYAKFWLSILILKVQRTSMSFKSSFGALEDAGGSWLGFGILILIWIWSLVFDLPILRFLAPSWFLRCKEHPCPLNPDLKLWWGLEVPDWCLTSWSWFGNNHWSLIYLYYEFGLSNLNLKLQRTSISIKS